MHHYWDIFFFPSRGCCYCCCYYHYCCHFDHFEQKYEPFDIIAVLFQTGHHNAIDECKTKWNAIFMLLYICLSSADIIRKCIEYLYHINRYIENMIRLKSWIIMPRWPWLTILLTVYLSIYQWDDHPKKDNGENLSPISKYHQRFWWNYIRLITPMYSYVNLIRQN